MLKIYDACECARYSNNLEIVINSLEGEKILDLKYESDYSGYVDIAVLLKDGRVFTYYYSYGSCCGCDEWEVRELTNNEIEAEMLKDATFFDSLEDYKKFKEKRESCIND